MTQQQHLEAFRNFARQNEHKETYLGRTQARKIRKLLKEPNVDPVAELAAWIEIGRDVLAFQQRNIKRGRFGICKDGLEYVYTLQHLVGNPLKVKIGNGEVELPAAKIQKISKKHREGSWSNFDYHVTLENPLAIENIVKINRKIVSRSNQEITEAIITGVA